MARRVGFLVTVVLVASALAGCFGEDAIDAASVGAAASRAEQMLESPPGSDVVPTGRTVEFDLYLHPMVHTVYPGATMGMWGFSLDPDPSTAHMPGPTLRVTEGDLVIVRLTSTVAGFSHTLHFHGQHVPSDMDGVPYMSQEPVPSGETFTYTFVAKPAGTYWYHCHVDAQHHIDMGMYGALIVDPQDPATDPRYDGEFLMMMDDMDRFHVEGGTPTGTGNLPQSGDPFAYEEYARRVASDAVNRNEQVNDAMQQTPLRPPRSWYPETYAPYTANYNTWLINGAAFPNTPALVVEEGKTYRIRLINVANSPFPMHLHGHHFLVTHKDGILLQSPYWADTVFIAPGERYDVYVKTNNPGMWDFHSHDARQTQNDNVFPGGAMTTMCYVGSAATCMGGEGHEGHGMRTPTAGSLIHWYGHELP